MLALDAPIVVLYVEDDERLARLTTQYLEGQGLTIHMTARGDHAIAALLTTKPDVVLLDLMLPGRDGLDVCRGIRARVDVPIIMVTARTDEADRVLGLESGADDYVTKPFQSRELLARIRAQVRRARGEAGPRPERIRVGAMVIDAATREVTIEGSMVSLTNNEFALLHVLAQRAGRVLSRDQLLHLLHGTTDQAFDRSIDVVVSRLRGKLEVDARNPRLLKTIRGAGYMLAPDER